MNLNQGRYLKKISSRGIVMGWVYPLLVCVFICSGGLAWAGGPNLSKGQTLYVPSYSHIYIGHKAKPYSLTVTLSIRNIDPNSSLTLETVEFYNTQGKPVRRLLDPPLVLKPMASTRYVIPSPDETGGSGANFIVSWSAEKAINAPIVETIMIGTQSQQGISFTSRGQEIRK